jgi:hypothetical protein
LDEFPSGNDELPENLTSLIDLMVKNK